MNLFIAIATKNAFLQKEFLKLRNKIAIPADLSELAVKLELGAPDIERLHNLEDYFHHRSKSSDAMLVLADQACVNKLAFTQTALFTYKAEIPDWVKAPENFLSHHLARMINSFSSFKAVTSRGENYVTSILPALNFDAPEWRELVGKVSNETHSDTFVDEALALIVKLRKKRRKPRRKDPYDKFFFIDEDDKHFTYAVDHHSHIGTGEPHTKACELNGTFRFGRKVADPRRHFDVNRGPGNNPSIKGAFQNCHKEVKDVTKTSHLNMFMNDFF